MLALVIVLYMLIVKIWLRELFPDNISKDRACEIAIDPKCDGNQRGLPSMVYRVFDKKTGSEIQKLNEKIQKSKSLCYVERQYIGTRIRHGIIIF